MQILFFLSIFLSYDGYEPKSGDWICWYRSKDTSKEFCGTYGMSKSKKVAKEKGSKLCEDYCDAKCELDYCDIL